MMLIRATNFLYPNRSYSQKHKCLIVLQLTNGLRRNDVQSELWVVGIALNS
jgi:hypothetical protein